jgi:hypothetical protein
MGHVWERKEMHTGFQWGNRRGKYSAGNAGRSWEDNIKIDVKIIRMGGYELDSSG